VGSKPSRKAGRRMGRKISRKMRIMRMMQPNIQSLITNLNFNTMPRLTIVI
jgi:hypothetical protein